MCQYCVPSQVCSKIHLSRGQAIVWHYLNSCQLLTKTDRESPATVDSANSVASRSATSVALVGGPQLGAAHDTEQRLTDFTGQLVTD
jgi:hypothetical protein